MLRLNGVQQYYAASHTLWDISLEVPKGACFCLMGRNGVGKTTLLKAIMGLIPIHEGELIYQGVNVSKLKAETRAELGIAYVPQGREIFPLLTVEENLRTGLRAAAKQGVKKIPEVIFELFPVLKQMLKRRGGDLSGGQQQQLAIGRALVLNPQLLILDEPTEGVQPNIVNEIGDVILRLKTGEISVLQRQEITETTTKALQTIRKELGITVLIVEQKLPFARKIADQFGIMDRGRLVALGNMPDLNAEMVKRYLTV
jgi:urea transport system ATP-binding protein